MNEHYYKKSDITGRTYNIFNSVNIINPQQVAFFLKKHVKLMDIKISKDKRGRDLLVFVFDKTDSRDAYILWRNYGEAENATKFEKKED